MEWITCITKTIRYIEEHILEEDCAEGAARQVYVSPMLLNKGFQILTGYTIPAYIRSRRLYLAALELQNTESKVIDIALTYGFETPESFTKAFARFHGVNPRQVRQGAPIRSFLPLKLNISVQGGDQVDCRIQKIPKISIAGYTRVFASEDAHDKIPKFWEEVMKKDPSVGEYAVCMDDLGDAQFHYMIGKRWDEGSALPGEMTVYHFEDQLWAVFECMGENPQAIQQLDEKIWKEWLPGNPEYELHGNANIEWYGEGNHSAIWIPVRSLRLCEKRCPNVDSSALPCYNGEVFCRRKCGEKDG